MRGFWLFNGLRQADEAAAAQRMSSGRVAATIMIGQRLLRLLAPRRAEGSRVEDPAPPLDQGTIIGIAGIGGLTQAAGWFADPLAATVAGIAARSGRRSIG